MTEILTGRLNCAGNGAVEGQVIILDQYAIEEAHSMIQRAAACNGVFVEGAKAGSCFPGVDDLSAGSLNAIDILARGRCDAAHPLEHVKRCAFRRKDGASGAVDFRKLGAGRYGGAVG